MVLKTFESRLNILLSTAGFFPNSFGGGQVYVYRLAKELIRRGHDVTILTSDMWQDGNGENILNSYEYGGIPVRAIRLNPKTLSAGDLYSELSPILMENLRTLLKRLNPDVVHINGIKAPLILICNELNRPNVVTAHHPGFACPAGDLLTPDEGLCEKRAHPTVCIPCCSFRKTSNYIAGWILGHAPRWAYKPVGEILNKNNKNSYIGRGLMFPWLIEKRIESQRIRLFGSKFIISPSIAMTNLLIRNGVNSDKMFLVPHGIEPIPRLPLDRSAERKVRFGYIGSYNRGKGFHILLEALERVEPQDDCELHIFGGAQNPWDKKFIGECMARYSGKSRIIDHGYVSHDELPNAFKEIEVLVVPSIYLEVFGLVILEAFSAGRPVIVSKSGGPEELVRDSVTGFVVERNSSEALARAMQKIIDNPNRIHDMSQQITNVKTIHEYVDEMEKIYISLLPKTELSINSLKNQLLSR